MTTRLLACYTAESGVVYSDDTHTDALFAAEDAGEPEVMGFPHDARFEEGDALERLEARMGFLEPSGTVLTRAETMAKYGFDLAEEQEKAA